MKRYQYRIATGRLLSAVMISILVAAAQPAAAADGRLAGTGGVSSINGTGGGGLTGWATLASYADQGQNGFTGYISRADVDDFRLDVAGATATFSNRLELGAARQRFRIKAAGVDIDQVRYTAKWRVLGDLLYGAGPQVSVAAEHGRLQDPATARALGARRDSDTEWIVSVANGWIDGLFHRTTAININLRHGRANQFGILGYEGDDNDSPWQLEASAVLFPFRDIAIGAEYRQKPDNLSAIAEDPARDFFVAWFPDKRFSLTAAWLDLGRIAGQADQQGYYLSLQVAL